MASNNYQFLTRWLAPGAPAEIYDVLIRGVEFVRWWPEVYLEVHETDHGGKHGLGKAAQLLTKGKLPYKLRWSMRITETDYPFGFSLDASGDFVGRGVWRFTPAGDETEITFDWRLRAEKPLLRYLSFLLKPAFAANHRWAMSCGEAGLNRELQRLRQMSAK